MRTFDWTVGRAAEVWMRASRKAPSDSLAAMADAGMQMPHRSSGGTSKRTTAELPRGSAGKSKPSPSVGASAGISAPSLCGSVASTASNSTDQRSAASYLGYTQSLWNDEDFWNTGGTGTREEAYFNARYADLEWTDLTVIQQVAFAYLGYGSGSYSDFYNDYSFDELPADVQAAADAVGYDRDVWDSCTAEVCSSQVDNDLWQDHSRTERANLKVLGYTCWTWNNYDFGSGGRRGRV